MTETDQLDRFKYKFVIYHGYIHIIPICEESKQKDENLTKNI